MPDQTFSRPQLEAGFHVGAFYVEPQGQRISGESVDVRVEPKVMDVLVHLALHAGQTVSKRHFMDAVWDETVVTDDALLRCISELRKVFSDDPRTPQYIETIRKRGYRLVAPVDLRPTAAESPPAVPPATVSSAPAAAVPYVPSPTGRRSPRSLRRFGWFVGSAGVLVLAAGLLLLAGRLRSEDVPPPHAVPLTSYPGVESDPNLSPDGSRIAFVWDQGDGGSSDVYIKQVGVETPLRLTQHPAADASPAWSPDGAFLAFARSGAAGNAILLVPAVGGAERQVADLGQRAVHSVVWSPDGQTLAFSAERTPHGPLGISLLSLQTLEERPLTRPPGDYRGDVELAFSPDGRRLAFSRSVVEKVDDLHLVSVDGGELKRVTYDHAEITGLDWSRDGRQVFFTSDRAGSPALWRVEATGGAPTWVPTPLEGSGVHQPSVARHLRRMAYLQRLQETNIWSTTLTPAPAEPSRIVASTRWDSNPALSPDGTRLAFASNRTGSYEIWISDADGGNPLQMTRFGGPFTNTPRWSPDGTRLVFVARNEGSVDLYVMQAGGGAPRQLTTAASNDTAPSWTRDGAWIYFASNRTGDWQVWKIPAGGGTPEQVTRTGGYAAWEDPTGTMLYFTRRDTPGIWRMPLGGGTPERVVTALQPFDWGNWKITATGLYYVARRPEGAALLFHDLATRRETTLLSLDLFPKHPALSLSDDGRLLVRTRIDRLEGDIWLTDVLD